jgi:hypothetical protein
MVKNKARGSSNRKYSRRERNKMKSIRNEEHNFVKRAFETDSSLYGIC